MRYPVLIVAAWLAVAAGARAQTPLAHPGQAGYTRTDQGCFVWNPKPGPDESVSWSGACVDGLASGSGTRQWRSGGKLGSRYTGTMLDGKEDGTGTLTYANGDHYDGEWHDGKPNGQGSFTTSSVVVKGEWKDGCFKHGTERAWVNVDPLSCP